MKGEICQISPLNLANLDPKIAVKRSAIFRMLIIKELQKEAFRADFVKIFHKKNAPFYPSSISISQSSPPQLFARKGKPFHASATKRKKNALVTIKKENDTMKRAVVGSFY